MNITTQQLEKLQDNALLVSQYLISDYDNIDADDYETRLNLLEQTYALSATISDEYLNRATSMINLCAREHFKIYVEFLLRDDVTQKLREIS